MAGAQIIAQHTPLVRCTHREAQLHSRQQNGTPQLVLRQPERQAGGTAAFVAFPAPRRASRRNKQVDICEGCTCFARRKCAPYSLHLAGPDPETQCLQVCHARSDHASTDIQLVRMTAAAQGQSSRAGQRSAVLLQVCLDVDGTMLNSQSELSPAVEQAIKACRDAGVQVQTWPWQQPPATLPQSGALLSRSYCPPAKLQSAHGWRRSRPSLARSCQEPSCSV